MKNDDFSITEEKAGDVSKFIIAGRITSLSANVIQHKLNEAFRAGQKNMVLNMMQVAFLSSAGIRVLLIFYRRAKEAGGSFYIESPSDNVINVLGMTALDEMLLKDASAGIRKQGGGDRRQGTGDRRQETGDRRQSSGDRRQEKGDRRQREGRSEDRG